MRHRVAAVLLLLLLGMPVAEARDPNPRYCKTAGVPCVTVTPPLPASKNPGLRPERSPLWRPDPGVGPCL